jgi:ribosomal protection tetracycline resistance protein
MRWQITVKKVIVDGYNLIYAHPELGERVRTDAREARETLITILSEYVRARKVKVILVFDSRLSRAAPVPSLPPRLEVVFSRSGLSADELIVKMIESERRPRDVTVVSSDYKDIGRVAKSLGIQVLRAQSFWGEILKQKKRGDKSGEKPTSVSGREVEYWLEEFEGRDEPSEDG